MSKLIVNPQLAWMQADYEAAHNGGSKHTFVFTHGPIVGHGGGATHDTITPGMGGAPDEVEDRDIPFVEWVNEAGMTVEAVFVGHTHMTIGDGDAAPYQITVDNMDNPRTFNTNSATVPFSWNAIYIETNTATKRYP